MSLRLDQVFRAEPKSSWSFLQEAAQGLYIPAYQRPYSWSQEQVNEFIENAVHGLNLLSDSEDSITFIGTIITIQDTQYQTISPIVREDVPRGVLTIIDGQQRLSTLLLLYSVCLNEISYLISKLNNSCEYSQWIRNHAMQSAARLHSAIEMNMNAGEMPFYPRLIRAFKDQWSKTTAQAKYTTPIAYFLKSFGEHHRSKNSAKRYQHEAPTDGVDDSEHAHVAGVLKKIRKVVKRLIEGGDGEDRARLPDRDSMSSNSNLQSLVNNSVFPGFVADYLRNNEVEDKAQPLQLLRLQFLVSYIMDRMALTVVTAQKEDYAFDMFEALNTTGEPLTAFETFKPRVIEAEELANYESSDSFPLVNSIESKLNKEKPADRQRATTDLIIPLALAEEGRKVSKKLSHQRTFLRGRFDQLDGIQDKRNFVRYISNCTDVVFTLWERPENGQREFGSDFVFALEFLKKANHHIILAPLMRLYDHYKRNQSEDNKDSIVCFVKTVAAYFAVWRGSRSGTDGIDTVYRELMSAGLPEGGIPPLARSFNNEPDITRIRTYLKDKIRSKGRILSKDDWVNKAASSNAYGAREVTRFILLAAFHDSVGDDQKPGELKPGRATVNEMFKLGQWRNENLKTVEHIAPQSRNEGWDEAIYEDAGFVHRLGNLTLLPQPENASLGNRPWQLKKQYYSIFSATSDEEVNSLVSQVEESGITVADSTKKMIEASQHMSHLGVVSKVDDWNHSIIQSRGKNIARLASERLEGWLGFQLDD